jgi:hypothetical protein
MSAITRAAGRMERARGSRAGLPLRPRHFPIARGPAGRDRAGGLFRSGDIREPRRLPRRHFLQHPKADHFLQPRGEQRFRQTQRRLDFSISAKFQETLIQYQEGPTVPDHRQCFAQGRGLLGQGVPLHRPSPRASRCRERWFLVFSRILSDNSESPTNLDIVRAPIIAEPQTIASRRLASEFSPLSGSCNQIDSLRKPFVATFRVSPSARATSLPSAANGKPDDRPDVRPRDSRRRRSRSWIRSRGGPKRPASYRRPLPTRVRVPRPTTRP